MKYKVGDKVRIKSLDWYNENKDKNGIVNVPYKFIKEMNGYCGKEFIIQEISNDAYLLDGIDYTFSDDMFEPVEESVLEIPAGYKITKIECDKIYLKKSEITTYDTIPNISGFITEYKFLSVKEVKSASAMAQISQLMPYYGGKISNEEWNNPDIKKYCIIRNNMSIDYCLKRFEYEFLAFHTEDQRTRFTSYPENVQLVKDYLMIA